MLPQDLVHARGHFREDRIQSAGDQHRDGVRTSLNEGSGHKVRSVIERLRDFMNSVSGFLMDTGFVIHDQRNRGGRNLRDSGNVLDGDSFVLDDSAHYQIPVQVKDTSEVEGPRTVCLTTLLNRSSYDVKTFLILTLPDVYKAI